MGGLLRPVFGVAWAGLADGREEWSEGEAGARKDSWVSAVIIYNGGGTIF